MKRHISQSTAATYIRRCTIDNMRGFQTKTEGYCRSFLARYYDEYINQKGEKVFRNMQRQVRGFNDIARYIKEEFTYIEGSGSDIVEVSYCGEIYVSGSAETYEDNYGVHVCITILSIGDIFKLEGNQ